MCYKNKKGNETVLCCTFKTVSDLLQKRRTCCTHAAILYNYNKDVLLLYIYQKLGKFVLNF